MNIELAESNNIIGKRLFATIDKSIHVVCERYGSLPIGLGTMTSAHSLLIEIEKELHPLITSKQVDTIETYVRINTLTSVYILLDYQQTNCLVKTKLAYNITMR